MARILVAGFLFATLVAVPRHAAAQDEAETAAAQLAATFNPEFTYDHIAGGGQCAMLGELTLTCRSHWTTTGGVDREAIFIVRWDPAAEAFRGYRFYENGYADSGFTWVDGDTWTTVYEGANGRRFRITQTFTDTGTEYVWHRSDAGGPWVKTGEGSTTNVR